MISALLNTINHRRDRSRSPPKKESYPLTPPSTPSGPYETPRMTTGSRTRDDARSWNVDQKKRLLSIKLWSKQSLIADMEKFGTHAYDNGRILCLDLNDDVQLARLPKHVQRWMQFHLADSDELGDNQGGHDWYQDVVDYCKAFMRRQQHHCTKCNVNCNINSHKCHDCVLLQPTPMFHDGVAVVLCNCLAPCEYSVLPKHRQL